MGTAFLKRYPSGKIVNGKQIAVLMICQTSLEKALEWEYCSSVVSPRISVELSKFGTSSVRGLC